MGAAPFRFGNGPDVSSVSAENPRKECREMNARGVLGVCGNGYLSGRFVHDRRSHIGEIVLGIGVGKWTGERRTRSTARVSSALGARLRHRKG
ncbi:hypothetical protein D9M68_936330 [compost metagenome]